MSTLSPLPSRGQLDPNLKPLKSGLLTAPTSYTIRIKFIRKKGKGFTSLGEHSSNSFRDLSKQFAVENGKLNLNIIWQQNDKKNYLPTFTFTFLHELDAMRKFVLNASKRSDLEAHWTK